MKKTFIAALTIAILLQPALTEANTVNSHVPKELVTNQQYVNTYNAVLNGLNSFNPKIVHYTNDYFMIGKTVDYALHRSKNFLLIESVGYSVSQYQKTYKVEVSVKYRITPDQYKELVNFANQLNVYRQQAKLSTHDTIKYVNDSIMKLGTYSLKGDESYSPYTLLHDGYGVCQSYTALVKIVLDQMQIPNYIVTGQLNNAAHTWNLVNINGTWLNLDVTSNDVANNNSRFFLVTDEALTVTHQIAFNQYNYVSSK